MTGDELRRWRERVDWSQGRLADALDLPANTVARWERGEMPIRHDTILRFALRWLEQENRKRASR